MSATAAPPVRKSRSWGVASQPSRARNVASERIPTKGLLHLQCQCAHAFQGSARSRIQVDLEKADILRRNKGFFDFWHQCQGTHEEQQTHGKDQHLVIQDPADDPFVRLYHPILETVKAPDCPVQRGKAGFANCAEAAGFDGRFSRQISGEQWGHGHGGKERNGHGEDHGPTHLPEKLPDSAAQKADGRKDADDHGGGGDNGQGHLIGAQNSRPFGGFAHLQVAPNVFAHDNGVVKSVANFSVLPLKDRVFACTSSYIVRSMSSISTVALPRA